MNDELRRKFLRGISRIYFKRIKNEKLKMKN